MKMNYKMDELLPIVARLAQRYDSKESTSISYERARHLMEAVLYCINGCDGENQLVQKDGVAVEDAYQSGYENLVSKVKNTQASYNKMIVEFCAYGNENYHDTVTKAIPYFFRFYDVRYAPQETLITLDYPTICPLSNKTGIEAVAKYIEYISYEQKFMNALPRDYVYDLLFQFHTDYRHQFYNICSIVLQHILVHMLVGKNLGEIVLKEDYNSLRWNILKNDCKWLEDVLSGCLRRLIMDKYEGDRLLEKYLQYDLKNIATELYIAAEKNQLENLRK